MTPTPVGPVLAEQFHLDVFFKPTMTPEERAAALRLLQQKGFLMQLHRALMDVCNQHAVLAKIISRVSV
jgi:hypothetical protein